MKEAIKMDFTITPIGYIFNDFDEKFGIPRQSGLATSVISKIILEKEFRSPDAIRGLEQFDYIWLIWQFSKVVENRMNKNEETTISLTVRPPKLGGNTRVGVFASRSPFRPNALGLSSVLIDHIDYNSTEGPIIYVKGADLLNGTPIFDIKPYLPYVDAHPAASNGFAESTDENKLEVYISKDLENILGKENILAVKELLSLDPRPSYQNQPDRVYGISYGGYNISFTVVNKCVNIVEISKN